jgi:cell wall-associated NlpC family hydrolase
MRIEAHLPELAPTLQQIAAVANDREACGVIIDEPGIVRLPNVAADPTRDFSIGPLHALPPGAIAIWHTHPDDEPPSAPDRAGCSATALPWLIAGPTKLWALHPRQLPLIGREFAYGVEDCWQCVSDWFAQERGVFLPWFPRPADGWWHEAGESPYLAAAAAYGFGVEPVSAAGETFRGLKPGDVLLMQIAGRRVNHSAVYLGGGAILHHLYDCLSVIEQLDERLQRFTRYVARHTSLS